MEEAAAEIRAKHLFPYVASVIIGPPLAPGYPAINTGSGVMIKLGAQYLIATANHVLESYEKSHAINPSVTFQVGHLNVDMRDRSIWRRKADDLAILTISAEEANRVGSKIHEPPTWPPRVPLVNEYVTLCGLPIMARSRPDSNSVIFGPMVASLVVLSSFENHFTCRIEREHLESILNRPLPLTGVDYGGLSGGPVFLERKYDFPLAGIVKEVNVELEYFIIQCFGSCPTQF